MDCVTILAQTVETTNQTAPGAETPAAAPEGFVPINFIWEQIVALNLVEALTFVCFGAVCVFYGWRIFKILVMISFAMIGLFVGVWTNRLLIGGNEIWLGIICMVFFAFFSVPLMRWGVSVLGAAAGGILGGGVWYAVGLPEQYILAGALVGVVGGGMISFIIFKAAVMLFTSLSGSGLIVVGILAIIYQRLGAAERVEELIFTQKWFLPVVLLAPTAAGIILQIYFVKGSKNCDI